MIYKAPQSIIQRDITKPSVFLGGSIEMGAAELWQDRIGNKLSELGYNIFNPRRDEWDNSWVQEFTNPQFYQQVNWELNALEKSDYIIMYFDPNTKSPISLLVLGLFAHKNKLLVVCPDGFWRKGNVDIVCDRYGIQCFNSLEKVLEYLSKIGPNQKNP